MVTFKKKFYLFQLTDTWFRYQPDIRNLFLLRSYSFVHKPALVKWSLCVKCHSHTLEIALDEDKDIIFSRFSKTVRQQMRIGADAGVVCLYKDDIDTFVAFYNEFASLKKIYPAQRDTIINIGKNFKVSFAFLNNEILVAHSYIIDEELGITRLFQSASKRLDAKFEKNIVSCANRFLTASDIKHFKALGFKVMDFGGYAENTTNQSLIGINNFKLSFGGRKVTCTDYNSVPYYVLRKIAEFFDRRY